MGLEKVRERIIERVSEREKIAEERRIEEEIERSMEMGEGFLEAKNYPACYFMYFRAFKSLALLYVKKKADVELSEGEALLHLAKKKKFGFDQEVLREMLEKYDLVLNRKEAKRKDCLKVRRAVKKIAILLGSKVTL